MPRGMNKTTKLIYEENTTNIYKWIEANKHKYPKGINSSVLFSGVVRQVIAPYDFYPDHISVEDPLYTSYCQLITRMRKRGFLRRERPAPYEPAQYSVVEAMLPAGVATYTGVKQAIPLEPTAEPNPPTPEEPIESDQNTATAAFLEAELRSIKIRDCRFGNGQSDLSHAVIEMHDVTLWDAYKLGLALQQTLGTTYHQNEVHKEEDEQITTQQQEETINSVEHPEETEEYKPTVETGSPF